MWKISHYHTGLMMWLGYDYAVTRAVAREHLHRLRKQYPTARFRIERPA